MKEPEAEMIKNDYLGWGRVANLFKAVSDVCTEKEATVIILPRIVQKSNISILVCYCRTLPLPLQVVGSMFSAPELGQVFWLAQLIKYNGTDALLLLRLCMRDNTASTWIFGDIFLGTQLHEQPRLPGCSPGLAHRWLSAPACQPWEWAVLEADTQFSVVLPWLMLQGAKMHLPIKPCSNYRYISKTDDCCFEATELWKVSLQSKILSWGLNTEEPATRKSPQSILNITKNNPMALRWEQAWHTKGTDKATWLRGRAVRHVTAEKGCSHFVQSLMHHDQKSEMYPKFSGSLWRVMSRESGLSSLKGGSGCCEDSDL